MSEFDEFQRADQSEWDQFPTAGPDTRTVLRSAVPVKPDDAAAAVQLAKRYPQPTDVLLRNLQDAKLRAAVDDADARLRTSPKLAEHMRNNPWAAMQAHDDIPALTEIDKAVAQYGELKAWRGPEPTFTNVVKGLANAIPQSMDAVRAGLDAQMSDFLESLGLITVDPIERKDRERKLAQAVGRADFTRPDIQSPTLRAVYGGVESTLRQIPGVLMSVLTRNPTPMLTAAGVQTEAEAYGKYKARGAGGGEAFLGAVGEGAVEVATELIPGKFLSEKLGKVGLNEFFTGLLAREIPSEQVATLLQDAIDTAVANPDKTWGEYLNERPQAFYETLVSTLTQSALMAGASHLASRVAKTAVDEEQALRFSDALEQILKAAEASALRERNPEAFRAMMAELSDNGTVYVTAEVLNQMPASVLQQMQGVAEELPTALATGDTVAVKLADAMTLLAGTPQAELFMQHARVRPDAPSAFEAEQAGKKAGEFLRQEAERVLAQAQDRAAMQADHDAVKKIIYDQLIATDRFGGMLRAKGKFSTAVAEGYATWAAAFYTTMAARDGTTAQEMYRRFPLRILAEASQGGQAVMDSTEVPQPVVGSDISVGGNDPHTRRYELKADGRLVRTITYPDGQTATEWLVTNHKGDETWVSTDRYEKGAFYPVLLSEDAANAKVAEDLPANALNQSAYHGTPHRGIEKFSTDKIGTGEGAQAYGWGLYFASKREIAEHYRKTLTNRDEVDLWTPELRAQLAPSLTRVEQQELNDLSNDMWKKGNLPADQMAEWRRLKDKENAYKESVERLRPKGQLYEVEIPDDEHMLLWDKPLSEQPAAVRKGLEGGEIKNVSGQNILDFDPTGREIYEALSRNLADAKYASELLAEFGIKGIKYLDGTSRNAGDGSFNYVVFSGDDVAIKQQFYQRTANTGPRGTFNPRTLELVLSPTADLSTFFHETGHFFLEVMSDLASQPGAPAQIVDDMNQILAWFGVSDIATWRSMTLDQQRPYHERWAESIEQYVMEGKAPSAELQGPMRRFAAWLKSVYGSIKQFLAMRGVATSGPVLGQGAVDEYGMAHRPPGPDNGAPLNDLTGGGNVYPDDVYGKNAVQYYGHFGGNDPMDRATVRLVQAYRGNPDAPVKIYRAVPTGIPDAKINPGDWVTINKDYANYHGESQFEGGYEVLEVMVKAKDIFTNGDSLHEWGYWPGDTFAQGDQPNPSNIQLNDDIRRVMDRMLATDEQIAQANEMAGMAPDEDADAQAAERLRKRSMADLKWAVAARDKVITKLRKQARTVEKDIREQVTTEVDSTPEMRAKAALAKLRKEGNLNDATQAATADAFGYKSVDEMLQAIDAYGPRKDAIDSITQRRMLEEHGDLVDEDAIKQAANEAVHNEARARSLASELRTQREMLNPREDTGEVNAAGNRITVNALVEAAKQFGAQVVGRTPLADLRNRGWQHTAAERRAAKRWAEATAAGKTEEAVKAKQDQMLNNAAAKAALEARTEAQEILDFFKRVAKGNNEDVVEKGRDADVVNAARAVLAAYGVQTPTTKTADAYLDLVAKHDPETYDIIKPMVEGALRNAQPLDALTVDQLRDLHEEVQAMWNLSKSMRQMEVAGNAMDISEAAGLLHARLVEIGIPDEMPGETSAVTDADKARNTLQFTLSMMRRVEQWAERMDGGHGGNFLKILFDPIHEGENRVIADQIKYHAKFYELVRNIAPTFTNKLIEAPELNYTFGKGAGGVGHAELLHAILHTGNDSNKRKLLLGRQWATENADGTLDTSRWDAFITRLINEGRLEKAHYDFAQGVWDLLEETKPLAQKAHRDVFGRYFDEVTANEFITPFGTYRGGYVPAQADPFAAHDTAVSRQIEVENDNATNFLPAPRRGFTQARTEVTRPLLLNLMSIPAHIDKVLKFSHLAAPTKSAVRLLSDKGLSQAMRRVAPAATKGMLIPWLQRTATQQVEVPGLADGGLSRYASVLRRRAGASMMMGNLSNMAQQVTGLFTPLGADVRGADMVRAVWAYSTSPTATTTAVAELSEYMRTRMDNSRAEINATLKKILNDPSLRERAEDWTNLHAMFLQQGFDNIISPIVWTAAYNTALSKKMSKKMGRELSEAEAVRFADGIIRKTQGANRASEISRFEGGGVVSGHPFVRMFTQFAGYFNMVANTNATELLNISKEMGIPRRVGRGFYVVTMGVLMGVWIAEAVALAFKGGPDDLDKDGEAGALADWLIGVFGFGTLKGVLAMAPGVGQVANAAVNRFNTNPADDRISSAPVVSLIEGSAGVASDIYKATQGEANAQRTVRDVAALVQLATGLPAGALARPVGYAAGVADGKIDPTSPVDAARGLVTGVASPESKTR